MVARIEAREKHLKDLFGDKFLFEIPEFQRQFSWEKENFEQLVEDIKDALVAFDGKEPYFLGSIILWTKESHADGSGLFAVIDGQQRLTSIVILMACLRDLCQDSEEKRELQDCIYQKAKKLKGTSERVRLKVRDREHDFFKQYILYPDGTKKIKEAASPGLNESKQHILQAVEVFYGTFTNEQGVLDYGLIERFTIYLLQKIVLVVVKTDSLASGFRLFNIINARGMPLSNADLLKSENLRMVPEQSRPRYTKIWEDIEEEIGVDNLEMLISFMRSIYLRKKAQKAIFEEFNEKIFKENSNLKGQKFIERLSTISELYQGKIEDTTIKVTDIGNEVYYHNLVSIMRDFLPFNDWMTALIGFVEKFKEDKLLFKYVVLLEKKIAVEWVIGRSFTQRLTQIYRIIELIDNAEKAQQVLDNEIFDLQSYQQELIDTLNDTRLYNRGRTRVPKYILLRLDMERRDNLHKKVSFRGYITVEHILPQTATHQYWTSRFDKLEQVEWTNRLGNLVLLNRRKNSSASNRPFDRKVKEYFTKKSDFDVTNELQNLDEWNLENLRRRHENLQREVLGLWIR